MRLVTLALLLLFPAVHANGQLAIPSGRIQVMTLGVFHFSYPGLDEHETAVGNEIDVLQPKYQAEIERIVGDIKQFRPTCIAVEVEPGHKAQYDSLYSCYLSGKFKLGRNEVFQIGFRLGKELGIKRLSCVDEQGRFYGYLDTLLADSARLARFEDYIYHNPDSLIRRQYQNFYTAADKLPRSRGILYTLKEMNRPEYIRHMQGAYFIGDFRYEEKSGDFTGVDFETCRWYNRNLRIFRNIQRITNNPADRILLIIGDGHLGLLNYFFQCSPQYELVSPLKYLR